MKGLFYGARILGNNLYGDLEPKGCFLYPNSSISLQMGFSSKGRPIDMQTQVVEAASHPTSLLRCNGPIQRITETLLGLSVI